MEGQGGIELFEPMNTSNFSAAARKHMVEELKQHGPLWLKAINKHHDAKMKLFQSVVEKHATAKCGGQWLEEFAATKLELEEMESALHTAGFDTNRTRLILHRNAPDELEQAITNEIEEQIGSVRDITERFDNARMAMITAQNLDDAEKILKSIQDLIN